MAASISADTLDGLLLKLGYQLGEKVGSGSYAEVRALKSVGRDTSPKALKIVDRSKAPKDFVNKFFPRELSVLHRVRHPNIIRVYEILEYGSKVCILMDRATGGDLLEYIMTRGHLVEKDSRLVFKQLAEAVKFCHDEDVAHRDLKCENILLGQNLEVRLTDFGFSRYCTDEETGMRVLSHTFCGSAAYAAPEVLQGKAYNPKMSDVWSLGVILYIMVSGVMPFDDSNIKKMLKVQLEKKWNFPSAIRNNLSPECQAMVRHLLEPDITKRATMNQVLRNPWLLTTPEKAEKPTHRESRSRG